MTTVSILRFKNLKENFNFYLEVKDLYKKILDEFTAVKFIDIDASNCVDKSILEKLKTDNIYCFGEIDYAYLLVNYVFNPKSRHQMINFLNKAKYFVYFCEIFENDDLKTVGNIVNNKLFAKTFFEKAKTVIMCNKNNIYKLQKTINHNNILYNPINGYSKFNKVFNHFNSVPKDVDILVYGNGLDKHDYRIRLIKHLEKEANHKNWKLIYGSFWGEDKEKLIKRAKIVVHIPSFSDLETVPWAKIIELQVNRSFFIVEHNSEIDKIPLKDSVVTYSNPQDLVKKVDFYLKSPEEMDKIVEANNIFTKEYYNLDELLKNIVNIYK